MSTQTDQKKDAQDQKGQTRHKLEANLQVQLGLMASKIEDMFPQRLPLDKTNKLNLM